MEISIAEYKLLKKIYPKKKITVNNEISDSLISKGLVKREILGLDKECCTIYSDEIELTTEGTIAYENYHKQKLSVRRANIQSWIAIAISICSLAVSIISLMRD